MNSLDVIKNSFEMWYNDTFSKESPVSAVINYSDEQNLSIKAIHTARIELCIIGIKDNMSYIVPIVCLKENYNHGTTTEEEARDSITEKLLSRLYSYRR